MEGDKIISRKRSWWPRWPLPSYQGVRWLFPRLVALIYFIAFASWGVQYRGLVGENGILPVPQLISNILDFEQREGKSLIWHYPTLLRFNSSDSFALGLITACCAFAVLVVAGVQQRVLLFLLWLGYLSLVVTGDVFMGFQWDALLLEMGLLTVWLAPGKWCAGKAVAPPPRGSVLVVHWLALRLMFLSGYVKIGGGDPVWENATALLYHYETQPLPNLLAWWVHQLPRDFHVASCWGMYAIELVLPFGLLFGRWGRLLACVGFVTLMAGVALTGNYNFFNLAAAVLGLSFLDDSWWPAPVRRWLGIKPTHDRRRLRHQGEGGHSCPQGDSPESAPSPAPFIRLAEKSLRAPFRVDRADGTRDLALEDSVSEPGRSEDSGRQFRFRDLAPEDSGSASRATVWLRRGLSALTATFVMLVTTLAADQFLGGRIPGTTRKLPDSWHTHFLQPLEPLRSFNAYGLFQDMTEDRPEIVIEVSDDGILWLPLEFRWKPGQLDRAPRQVAPHQPRLDWQMWFAALYPGFNPQRDAQPNSPVFWFGEFLGALLRHRQPVWDLIEPPPFPVANIRHVRARLYRYHFTDDETQKATGNYWRRELLGTYCPALSLRE